jgi:hypothetical protein
MRKGIGAVGPERAPRAHRCTAARRGRAFVRSCISALLAAVAWAATRSAQSCRATASLTGEWTLDRQASDFPREIGFGGDFAPLPRPGDPPGTRRSPIPRALRPEGESYDVAQRREFFNNDVRTPPERLIIIDTPDAVTITDENGRSRTLHPNGIAETVQLGSLPVLTMTRRDGDRLVVLHAVADLRQVRYTYSRAENPTRVIVEARLIEAGAESNPVRRVYRAPRRDPEPSRSRARSDAPASGRGPAAPPSVMPRAGSEFRGLDRLGIVVEPLSQPAIGCGISTSDLEAAVSKPFTDVGLRVSRNADEDTYIHVTVMTSVFPNGTCVTRWDWSIYSTADAQLSHQDSTMLAQVVLAHKGGLSGSLPATHGADLLLSMEGGLAQMAGIIRDANR